MPMGKGTYGSKVGRPKKKIKRTPSSKKEREEQLKAIRKQTRKRSGKK